MKLRDMLDLFKTLKRQKSSRIFCPRCGSPDIHLGTGMDYSLTPKKYICESCGYTGLIVLELEKEED